MTHKILVIEDDPDIASLVAMHLRDEGNQVVIESSGDAGLERFRLENFDLVVLDLMLPAVDGLTICREIRSGDGYVPILMLTAKSTELDRVLGLEIGADDYMTKPFSIPEFVARTKALFRRVDSISKEETRETVSKNIESKGIRIDVDKRQVEVNGKSVDLTAREFDLLHHFARHPGRVYSRLELLEQIWGYSFEGYEHTVNTHINRLRAKVEDDPKNPEIIETVWGVGYRMAE